MIEPVVIAVHDHFTLTDNDIVLDRVYLRRGRPTSLRDIRRGEKVYRRSPAGTGWQKVSSQERAALLIG